MKLLLLLSALLSALSGVSVGARTVQAPVAMNRVADIARVAAATSVRRADRPAAMPLYPADSSAAPIAMVLRLAPPAPLYLSRRRE